MGLRYLSGLCFAFFSFSSLAADPPVPRGNVSVTLNPTTSYYSSTSSTFRIPHGVSVSPVTSSVPVVTKYPAGLQQTIPTGITIDAIKKSAPLPAVVRSTTQSLKGAATRCLTGFKCNLAFMAGSLGLQELLDGVDWVMNEGGQVVRPDPDFVSQPVPSDFQGRSYTRSPTLSVSYPDPRSACAAVAGSVGHTLTGLNILSSTVIFCLTTKPNGSGDQWALTVDNAGSGCYQGYELVGNYCSPSSSIVPSVPVSPSDIAASVDSYYLPDPSDWRFLSPQLNLDDVEITSSPTLSSNPKTTTIYDADGNPVKVQETNTWYEFDVRDNPSSSPSLDLKTREQTKTYEDGVLTDTTTTESTASGGAVVPKVDIPTDCDFMPTVCAFLDWFKDDNIPDDPDLAKIINDEDFERSYTVNFGDNSCPQPISIDIAFLDKTIELSYEPACDLMGYARPFVLISAYIFAIYIGLGVVRNG